MTWYVKLLKGYGAKDTHAPRHVICFQCLRIINTIMILLNLALRFHSLHKLCLAVFVIKWFVIIVPFVLYCFINTSKEPAWLHFSKRPLDFGRFKNP